MNAITKTEATVAHKNVYVALAAAQAEMGPLVKGSVNPAFKSKYADLADLTSAVREPLTRNGLAYFHQMVLAESGRDVMRTALVHGESETRIECDVPLIVAKMDMQGMKSATTYAKRIGLESVTGIAPEDDDGNAAATAAPEPQRTLASEALRDAWRDAVEDSLPESATPAQKAEAYANAIIADFVSVKTAKTLEGRWDRHAKITLSLEGRYPDLHARVVDAYENHMISLVEAKS